MKRVAAAQGVPFVTMAGPLLEQLAGARREDWFVDPIHCTARGYALMAQRVADTLAAEGR